MLPGMPEEIPIENLEEPKSKESSTSDLIAQSKKSELKSNLSDIKEEAENSLENLPISNNISSIAKSQHESVKDTPKHNQSKLIGETPEIPKKNQSTKQISQKDE